MLRKIIDKVLDTTIAAIAGAGAGVLLFSELKNASPQAKVLLAQQFLPKAGELVERMLKNRPRGVPTCRDCGEYAYGFMLRDAVWANVVSGEFKTDEPELFICLECCAERLSRPITADDLAADAPINRPLFFAYGRRSHPEPH